MTEENKMTDGWEWIDGQAGDKESNGIEIERKQSLSDETRTFIKNFIAQHGFTGVSPNETSNKLWYVEGQRSIMRALTDLMNNRSN